MSFIYSVPLFGILLGIINIAFYLGFNLSTNFMQLNLFSNQSILFSGHEILIVIGVVTLFCELMKSTHENNRTIVEHVLSLLIFIIYLIEFLHFDKAGNFTFFILTLFSLLDVIAGFTITLKISRRFIPMAGGAGPSE